MAKAKSVFSLLVNDNFWLLKVKEGELMARRLAAKFGLQTTRSELKPRDEKWSKPRAK